MLCDSLFTCSFESLLLRFLSLVAGSSRSVLSLFVRVVFVCDGVICTTSTCVSPSLGFSFKCIFSCGITLLPVSSLGMSRAGMSTHVVVLWVFELSMSRGGSFVSFPSDTNPMPWCGWGMSLSIVCLFIFVSSSAVFTDVEGSNCLSLLHSVRLSCLPRGSSVETELYQA